MFDLFRNGAALIVIAAYHNIARISQLRFCFDFSLFGEWYGSSVHRDTSKINLTVKRFSSKFAWDIPRESAITSIVFQRLRRRQRARLLHRLLPPSMLMAGRSTLGRIANASIIILCIWSSPASLPRLVCNVGVHRSTPESVHPLFRRIPARPLLAHIYKTYLLTLFSCKSGYLPVAVDYQPGKTQCLSALCFPGSAIRCFRLF